MPEPDFSLRPAITVQGLPDAHRPDLAGSHGKQAPAPLAVHKISAEEEGQNTRRIAASMTFQRGLTTCA
jgi:hypothetical protein